MQFLLRLSRGMDAISEWVGRILTWALFATVIVSAVNAIVRKAFDMSSNAYLEVQWYLFAAVFLLCAAWTLRLNEHIRIDVIYGRYSRRTQILIDLFGTLFFLVPACLLVLYESWPWFVRAFESGELSPSAGGLVLWPAKVLVPAGFVLLLLQGVSEFIKRVGFLKGLCPDPAIKMGEKTAEEELAAEILRQRGEEAL